MESVVKRKAGRTRWLHKDTKDASETGQVSQFYKTYC